ncbi:MAG TPA: hypothetical protein VGK89_09790 [Candidatus Eisenbacteria bacterium]|jgi:hypothetical protein
MGLEVILRDHFGLEAMLHIHDQTSLDSWRGCMSCYFTSMDKAIRDTVVGDLRQIRELREACQSAADRAKRARSHAKVLTAAVEDLAMLCFRILGGGVVQRGVRRGSRTNWSVARYRSLFYARSPRQMAIEILDHARFWRDALPKNAPSEAELIAKRGKAYGKVKTVDEAAFVEWYRREYPEAYAAIFF